MKVHCYFMHNTSQRLKETYDKLSRIRPSGSIKAFYSYPGLIVKFPFINHIWSFFTMFRYNILNSKTWCGISKLFNCELFESCWIIHNLIFIACKKKTQKWVNVVYWLGLNVSDSNILSLLLLLSFLPNTKQFLLLWFFKV